MPHISISLRQPDQELDDPPGLSSPSLGCSIPSQTPEWEIQLVSSAGFPLACGRADTIGLPQLYSPFGARSRIQGIHPLPRNPFQIWGIPWIQIQNDLTRVFPGGTLYPHNGEPFPGSPALQKISQICLSGDPIWATSPSRAGPRLLTIRKTTYSQSHLENDSWPV